MLGGRGGWVVELGLEVVLPEFAEGAMVGGEKVLAWYGTGASRGEEEMRLGIKDRVKVRFRRGLSRK